MALSMDEYIEQLLAEFNGPPALRTIIQNILDEPIPEATKRRLLKPLLPRPVPPVRKNRGVKRKALLAEFVLQQPRRLCREVTALDSL